MGLKRAISRVSPRSAHKRALSARTRALLQRLKRPRAQGRGAGRLSLISLREQRLATGALCDTKKET